jgi:hypothetical protein
MIMRTACREVNVRQVMEAARGWIERRALLVLGGAGTAAVLSAPRARAAEKGALEHKEFVAQATDSLSQLLPAVTPAEQDAYVYAAAAQLRRMVGGPQVVFDDKYRIDIKPTDTTRIFSITLLRAKPGAVQPPHNHPFYSVATMGLQGEVLVRNFEPAGDLPPYASRETFRLRQTRAQQLRRGDIGTLAPSRDNFHTFEAGPYGAVWIDVSTAHAKEGAGDFSYLRLTPNDAAGVGDVFEGRWGLKD